MKGSSRTRSSKNSPTHSRSSFAAFLILLTAAVALGQTESDVLKPAPTRDRKIVRRWALPGDPRGLALGNDGTIYVGLAGPQAVIAVDPTTGAVRKRFVLDSAEIASTKELVTLRTNADKTRLFIANGTDESAVILSLPDLAVLREITMEGETIHDVVPDPKGRYVYVMGRKVHVFDADGAKELRTLPIEDPMALAVSAVQRLLGAELKTLCMIHLSQKNNHESIVRDMCTRLLRRTGASIEFAIARQFEPTGEFDVARRRERTPMPGQMPLF